MLFNWFKIFNLTEFTALGLISKTYTVVLDGIGQKDILVTVGEHPGMKCDDIFLSLNLHDQNPFIFEERAIYINQANDVYLGFQVVES